MLGKQVGQELHLVNAHLSKLLAIKLIEPDIGPKGGAVADSHEVTPSTRSMPLRSNWKPKWHIAAYFDMDV